jgi:hypothetical protein
MKFPAQRRRFEITIQCEGAKFKHICAAHEETEAVERMMRSYDKLDPELINVKRLGALPATAKAPPRPR